MNHYQLEIIDVIAKEGSFKAAAKRLGRTQPTLSVSIKNLEEELGFQIFSRSEYRPSLTARGKAFLGQARQLLGQFRELENYGQELAGKQEPFLRLAVDALYPLDHLENALRKFESLGLLTEVIISFEILDGTQKRLSEGSADIGIGPKTTVDEDLSFAPRLTVEMVPVLSPKVQIDSFEELQRFPQIVARSGGKDSRGTEQAGRKWYVSEQTLKEELISRGLGWGRLPRDIVQRAGLKKIEFSEVSSFEVDLYLISDSLKPLGPSGKKLLEIFSS